MYRWVIAGTAFLVIGMAWGSTGAYGVFVTPLTQDMGWSRTAVSTAYSINMMVAFSFGIFWGWLSDRWNVRGVITVAGIITGAGWLLAGWSDNLWQVYMFYGFIAGVGLGGVASPLTAIVVRWFPQRPGTALGIIYAGFGGASAILPIIAELFISIDSWRFGFRGLSFLIWGAFIVGIILLREPRAATVPSTSAPQRANPGDPSVSGERPSRSSTRASSFEGYSSDLKSALRTMPFWIVFAMMFCADLGLNMIMVHLVPQSIDAGIGSSIAATFLTVTGLAMMIGTMAGGVLGDQIGARRTYLGSMSLICIALIWLTGSIWVTDSPEMWTYYLFAVVFGLGTGGWFPQIAVLATRIFGTRELGSIFGALLVGAGLGGVVGPILAGYVFDTLGSYRIAFIIATCVAFVAVLLATSLDDSRRSPSPADASSRLAVTGD